MRKYILYIGFLLLSFASCQEKEIIGYSLERDGLQFNYDTNALRVTVDFMKEYVTDTIRWGPAIWEFAEWLNPLPEVSP